MVLWTLSFAVFYLALVHTAKELGSHGSSFWGFKGRQAELACAVNLFQELEESLSSGLIPASSRWKELERLAEPWGSLAAESVTTLRSQGSAVLPTLRRLKGLAKAHNVSVLESRAKSAQALGQAALCAVLVPIFSGALYLLLPGVESAPWRWCMGSLISMMGAAMAALWMLNLAETARWGGLKREQRPWILASQCAGERFLALLRSGTPADLAWGKTLDSLARSSPALAGEWGFSVWSKDRNFVSAKVAHNNAAARILRETGEQIRKALQVSLMEGKPCAERVESLLESLNSEIKAQIDREISLLSTRALKPLFLLVAPSLLGLLILGLWLESAHGALFP